MPTHWVFASCPWNFKCWTQSERTWCHDESCSSRCNSMSTWILDRCSISAIRQCPVTFSDHVSYYTTEPYSHFLLLFIEKKKTILSCPSAVQGKDLMNRVDCLICPSVVLTPLIGQNKMKKSEWLRKTELKLRSCFDRTQVPNSSPFV